MPHFWFLPRKNPASESYFLDQLCVYTVMSDFAAPKTVAHQAPLSMEFSRQEYWNGLPFPTPRHLPNPWIEPMSFTPPSLAGEFFTTSATWETPLY